MAADGNKQQSPKLGIPPPPFTGWAPDLAPKFRQILILRGGGLFQHRLHGQDPASAGQNRKFGTQRRGHFLTPNVQKYMFLKGFGEF